MLGFYMRGWPELIILLAPIAIVEVLVVGSIRRRNSKLRSKRDALPGLSQFQVTSCNNVPEVRLPL